jgi:hypothetical protein
MHDAVVPRREDVCVLAEGDGDAPAAAEVVEAVAAERVVLERALVVAVVP